MKAIVNTGPNQLVMQQWPTPEPGPGQVRIKTDAFGICATDLEMIAGWERTGFPAIPGHEWCGVVDAVGAGVNSNLIGSRCVAENVLADGGEVGFEHPGAYGEYFLTEARNLQALPADFPPDVAALIEPLAVSVRGMHRLQVRDRSRALVLGDGPIGLIMVMLLRDTGVEEITVVGGHTDRLTLTLELGAVQTFNYHKVKGDLAEGMRARQVRPFPTVVEASGAASAMRASLDLVAPCGRVLVLGDYGTARADFAWNHLLHQEVTLVGSNASAEAWPDAVRLAVEGLAPLERLITHRLPVEQFAEGVEIARSRDGIKVIMTW